MELLYASFLPFLAFPPLAFVPAAWFGVCYVRRRVARRRGGAFTLVLPAVVWAIYGVYEIRMYFWMKTVSAPIRVDLLLIVPLLYLLLAIGMWACYRSRRRRPGVEEPPTPG